MSDDPRSPCDLLVEGGLVMTLDAAGTIIADGAVAIAGTSILAVGKTVDLNARYAPKRRISARDRLVMPGLVNVHNHSPLMITRGMVEDLGFAPMYVAGIPQGHRLSAEEAYLLSRLGVWEMIRAGSTTIMDFYRYPESLAQAHAELGSRAVIAGRVHDADPEALTQGRYEHVTQLGQASVAENASLIQRWNNHDGGRIRCDWAPHAPDSCSDGLLREVAHLAEAHGGNIHTHLAQSKGEQAAVRARTGRSSTEVLDATGLLNQRTIAAHCIHLDAAEIALCGRAGITVAHSPIGNAKSGTIAPIRELMAAGARIALCTDTMSGDMIEATRWASSMQRILAGGEMVSSASEVLGWATKGSASALGLGDAIGALAPGRKADVILLDLTAPTMAPVVDGPGIVVYSGSGHDVVTSIIDGRVVMEDGVLKTTDGPELVREAQRVADRLWTKAGNTPVTVAA